MEDLEETSKVIKIRILYPKNLPKSLFFSSSQKFFVGHTTRPPVCSGGVCMGTKKRSPTCPSPGPHPMGLLVSVSLSIPLGGWYKLRPNAILGSELCSGFMDFLGFDLRYDQ